MTIYDQLIDSYLANDAMRIYKLARAANGKNATEKIYIPEINNVIFNGPATIIFWNDGTKTVVKCQPNDKYSMETGLALCIAKKALGNKGNFNNIFKKWTNSTK